MALYRESFVFRIAGDDPATIWSGFGDLLLPPDAVLPGPGDTLVTGGAALLNLPELEQLINGTAQRVDVMLSGVTAETLALAQDAATTISGAPVYIGRVRFDQAWQMVGGVEWEWRGEARGLTVTGEATETGRTRSLTLRVVSGDTVRSRAPLAFFTDADQRRAYPTDDFFSNVAAINAGTSRRWGPKD